MLNYTKLWMLLDSRGMKKTDLKQIMSANTLAKLGKNEVISSTVIDKICGFLNCQPGDIMEYIGEEQIQKFDESMESLFKAVIHQMKEQGIGEELFATMVSQSVNETIKNMYNDGNKSIGEINEEIVKKVLEQKE